MAKFKDTAFIRKAQSGKGDHKVFHMPHDLKHIHLVIEELFKYTLIAVQNFRR